MSIWLIIIRKIVTRSALARALRVLKVVSVKMIACVLYQNVLLFTIKLVLKCATNVFNSSPERAVTHQQRHLFLVNILLLFIFI